MVQIREEEFSDHHLSLLGVGECSQARCMDGTRSSLEENTEEMVSWGHLGAENEATKSSHGS